MDRESGVAADGAQWLKRHGRMLRRAGFNSRGCMPAAQRASPAAELAAIADWARSNLRADRRFRAWICVPDLESAPRGSRLMHSMQHWRRSALPCRKFGCCALCRCRRHAARRVCTGACGALELLAASVDAVSFDRFSALLRAPELQAGGAELAAAALLDVQLRKRGPSEADVATWLTLAERIAAARGHRSRRRSAAAAQRAARARRAARQSTDEPLGGRVDRCVLRSGPWSQRHRWSSLEFQAAERFRELLATARDGRLVLRHALAPVGAAYLAARGAARPHFRRRPASRRSG